MKKKILIVDDSAFMRSILRELLLTEIKEPLEIIEADGKLGALKQLEKHKPHLILLDVVMQNSEFEGIELLEELHKLHKKNKVIMITSIGQTSVIEACQKFGVVGYLQKPFDQSEVVERVKEALMYDSYEHSKK